MLLSWFVLFEIGFLQVHCSDDADTGITDALTTCSKGWFGFGDMCYRLGGRKQIGRLNWENAQKSCNDVYNADLATVNSRELQDFLTAFLLLSAHSNVWIGLHDRGNETDYKWVDGAPVNFTNFEPMEPSGFARDDEDCVEMVFKSARPLGKPGQWNDISCNHEIQFICQKAKGKFSGNKKVLDSRYCTTDHGTGWRFEKSCFYVVTESKTWSDAEQFCTEKVNGHLATIDYRVNEYLKYVLRDVTEKMWIGVKFKEEAQQKWSSGWLVSFENWVEQDEYVDDTCASREGEESWQVQLCKKKQWFLCEYSTETPPVLTATVEDVRCPEEPKGWRDLGGDLCYFFDIHAHIPWADANFNCMRRGGTLASIHSKNESDVLFQFVRDNPGYRTFIGLYRHMKYDEEFVWADGSKVDFTNWDSGEPNLEKEQCTELRTDTMKWNDRLCSEKRGYICSIHKVTPNITSTEIPLQSTCQNGISITSLIGVIICVLIFCLLIGLVLYHFKLCDRGYDRVKKLSGTKLPTPELDKKTRYRSEIIVTDDPDYDNLA